MHKVLSFLVLGVLAISGAGQSKQPSKKQTAATPAQKKIGTVSKTQTAGVKKPNPTPLKAAPTPTPEPSKPDPEADKKRFEDALAAPTSAEKARLLRIFLDEFPVSTFAGEAVEYLVTARAMIGSERLEAGDVEGAAASFRLVVDEAPTPIPDRLFNDVVLKSVLNLYHRSQQQRAMELAVRVEKKVAGNAKHLLGLAALYLGTENGTEARRLAEAAIAADPASAAGYQALGLAHRLNFDLEASEAAYSKAVEFDANSIAARRSLAELKRALGKSEEAAESYRAFLTANDSDTPSRTGLVLSLFDAGKRAEAEAELSTALSRDPRNFVLLAGAAYWYAANNQPVKAIEFAQKAIDAEPRYVWGHIAMARGLMRSGRPVDAERTLIKARQYGNFPTLDYEIASARFMAGLYREAIEELGKNFTIKDGVIRTKLGGRIPTEGKSFQEAVGNERRASILAPEAADDKENSEKMRLLFEISRKVDATADEAELSTLADEFVRGDDKMKLHRQLHIANLFLQKNAAVTKVSELLKASLGNADAGLDVAAPSAAVMASELYESRAVAFSRNEVLLIPDIPRQTLSAILRGRIEELSGWALYQQKNYPEAVIRLKRAVSVLPDKSAWWRSTMWRLGAALEGDGKDKEALDSYIQSYKTDRPNALRYSLIESLYVRVHGNREGLEDLIGANPQSAVSTLPVKPDLKPPVEAAAPAADPPRDVKELPHSDSNAALKEPASGSAESKDASTIRPQPAEEQLKKFEAKALSSETDAARANSLVPTEPEKPKVEAPSKTISSEVVKETGPPTTKTEVQAAERQIEKPPIIVSSAEVRPASVQANETAVDKKTADIVPLSELLNRKRPADSVETDGHGMSIPSADLVVKQLLPSPEPPRAAEAVVPTQVGDPANSAVERSERKDTSSETAAPPVEKEEVKAGPEPKKEKIKDPTTDLQSELPKPDPPKADSERAAEKTGVRSEPVNLLREPFAEPASKPPDKPVTKTEVVVNDPLKPSGKNPQSTSESKTLFEPIIITVPQTWKPSGKPSDAIKVETESASAEKNRPAGEARGSGATRTRLVDGKEVLSDQRCSIDVSDENISLLNGGGSLGVLVTIVGDGSLKELTASTTSPKDIEVRPEPEIEGLPGRRFYVVKSVSTRIGIYQVNFESPCGKREITVRVR